MKERDYMTTRNIATIRAMQNISRMLIPPYGIDEADTTELYKLLERLSAKAEKQIKIKS